MSLENAGDTREGSLQSTADGPGPIRLDGRLLLATLVAALQLLWPLLVYGHGGYIQDSAAYYKGGHVAVSFVTDKIEGPSAAPSTAQAPVPGAAASPGDAAAQPNGGKPDVRGARSVSYSIAAYIFGAPDAQMLLLALAQALVVGCVSAVTLRLFTDRRAVPWWKFVVLAVATPAAFVTCFILPDIFAAIVILTIVLLATCLDRMSRGVIALCVLIGAAGISFHASHLPIALGVTVAALAWMAYMTLRKAPPPRSQWALVAAPLILAAVVTVGLNFVAFGGPSLTGKRFPLTLARSVAEGPARWYLDKNCPHLKFAICEVYPHGVPGTIDSFLWGTNGIKERATPEQLDRIRAEESDVVLAATRAYPLVEIKRMSTVFVRQLFRFRPDAGFDSRIVLDPDGTPVLAPARFDPTWADLVHLLTIASLIAAAVVLYRAARSEPRLRAMVLLVLWGIVLNAAVCVYFSGITDRYQARVIWLIPLLGLAVLGLHGRRGAEGPASSRE